MEKSSWEDVFLKINEFISVMFRLPVLSKTADATERKLASWTARQRMLRNAGKLTEYKINKLNSLPFWHWGKEDAWMIKYLALVEFVNKNDRMPRNSKNSDDGERDLAIWCNTQKQAYNGKGTAKTNESRIKLLENIKHWKWSSGSDWHNKSWTQDKQKVFFNTFEGNL